MPSAHYIDDFVDVSGILFPTKGRIVLRQPDGKPLSEPVVSIELSKVIFTRAVTPFIETVSHRQPCERTSLTTSRTLAHDGARECLAIAVDVLASGAREHITETAGRPPRTALIDHG
jgi:hypothetical protein